MTAARLRRTEHKRETVASARTLAALLHGFRLEYTIYLIVSMGMAAVEGIGHPLLIKNIFDINLIHHNFKKFMLLIVGYFALGIFINVTSTCAALWNKSIENRLIKALSHRTLNAYYDTAYRSIVEHGSGFFISRTYGDLGEGVVPMLALVQGTLSKAALVLCSMLVLLYLSWQALLILFAFIPLSACVGTLLRRRIKDLAVQERDHDGAVLGYLTKALNAFRIVKGFQLFSQTSEGFDQRLLAYFSTTYRRYKLGRVFQCFNDLTMVTSDSLAMFVGAIFVLRGHLSFGSYLAFTNTFWRTVTSLVQLLSRLPEFHGLAAIVERITMFLACPVAGYYKLGQAAAVTNISVAYTGALVLKDVSLEISDRDRILILGSNGSGKTTLANVLSGFLAPSRGSVRLPETISSIALPLILPPLRVKDLPIDPSLLSKLGLEHQAILDGYSDELSAGQQQKLAIALALSRTADLYILDEPLACLDSRSRVDAMNLIFEKTRAKALVVIMHEVSTEERLLFDRIITMSPLQELPVHEDVQSHVG